MRYRVILIALALCVLAILAPVAALAAESQTCSYDPSFFIPFPAPGDGIISTTVLNITNIVNNLAVGMYNGLLNTPDFQGAAAAVLTLYIVIYGIMFMGGMTQVSLQDMVVRMVKLGIVAVLLVPAGSWEFFYTYMGAAFVDGKNELIGYMLAIGSGSAGSWTVINPNDPTTVLRMDPLILAKFPFTVLDNALAVLTSSKMAVTLIATFATGPYGIVIGILILLGLGSFAGALFQAMWVYLMSVVVTAFLFAVAPMFFVFLLFQRTRNLFDGWVNQLVSATVQPVFLFTFFSFFAALMWGAINRLLYTPVCWTPPGDVWRGTPFDIYIWRFMIPNGVGGWSLYAGAWSFTGPDILGATNMPVFPISIVEVLILVLLAQLSKRFNDVVLHIAREIAGASTDLNVAFNISRFFSPQNITDKFQQASAAQRAGAGGGQGMLAGMRQAVGNAVGRRPGAGGGGA